MLSHNCLADHQSALMVLSDLIRDKPEHKTLFGTYEIRDGLINVLTNGCQKGVELALNRLIFLDSK